jgi:NAD+ diphosphatase
LPDGSASPVEAPGREPVYLGRYRGRPCRALAISRQATLPAGLRPEGLLAAEPVLSPALLSLGGTAGQVLHWLRGGRYCDRCGAQTEPMPGEWGRRCVSCGYAHFPHIHPCVIVLVRRGSELLLTRKADWPPGRYSLVAGFLDFGECLEEAVHREVLEETGVRVAGVRYIGSQCWPFPSQLMAGFVADYAGGEVVVDRTELEDARWFPQDALPTLPPRRSIARYILDNFGAEC